VNDVNPEADQARPLLGRERANILLHEYDGLRTEIIHRTNNMYQLFAADALVMGWIATTQKLTTRTWIVLAIAAVCTVYLIYLINRDIKKAAERIREIEKQVDRDTGEWYLLRWERLWGGAKTTFLGRGRHLEVPDKPE